MKKELKEYGVCERLPNKLNVLLMHSPICISDKKIEFTGKRFTLTDKVYLDKDILFEWPDINKEIITTCGTCKGAKSQIEILVDGTVVPCCLDNDGIINLGNIFKSSLDDILNSKRYKDIVNGFNNNKLVEELCQKCGYRNRF